MKFTKFLMLALVLTTSQAFANGPWNRMFQDLKLPSQAMIEHYTWATPLLANTTLLKSSNSLSNSSTSTISSFSAQPDYPRNIVISPGGTTAGVPVGNVVVTGLNIYGKSISETFTFAAGQATAVTGKSAFKSVSSISLPQATSTLVVMSVGSGSKLGIPRCMANAGDYVFDELAGVYAATRGTMAVHATNVHQNTFQPNGTMDGVKAVDLFYVENFRCFPN